MTPQEALKETVSQLMDRRREENDAWWEGKVAKAITAVNALAAQHEKRLVRWTALNLLWTLVLAISSALWWLR